MADEDLSADDIIERFRKAGKAQQAAPPAAPAAAPGASPAVTPTGPLVGPAPSGAPTQPKPSPWVAGPGDAWSSPVSLGGDVFGPSMASSKSALDAAADRIAIERQKSVDMGLADPNSWWRPTQKGLLYGAQRYAESLPMFSVGPGGAASSSELVALSEQPLLDRLLGAINRADTSAPSGNALNRPPTSVSPLDRGAPPPDTGAAAPPAGPTPTPSPTPRGATPAGPSPGMGEPTPASAGAAATPSGAAAMTGEEAQHARQVADWQRYYRTVAVGERADPNVGNIDGITPTRAQQEQTVNAARDLKTARRESPEVDQNARALLQEHDDLRQQHYDSMIDPPQTRDVNLKAIGDQIDQELKTAWANKGTANTQQIVDAANSELGASHGALPPVKSVLKQVLDEVQNPDGSLVTDPEKLYRAHKLINYMQSRPAIAENQSYGSAEVRATLARLKAVVANTINDAAPGFSDAMANYSRQRGPIDAMEELERRKQAGLTGRDGYLDFGKIHKLMNDVLKARDVGADPTSPFAHMSDEQVNKLWDLHDNLRRVQSAERLATALGSDTKQNISDTARLALKLGTRGAAHAIAAATAPGLGNIAVEGATALLSPFLKAREANRLLQFGNAQLRPPPPPPPAP